MAVVPKEDDIIESSFDGKTVAGQYVCLWFDRLMGTFIAVLDVMYFDDNGDIQGTFIAYEFDMVNDLPTNTTIIDECVNLEAVISPLKAARDLCVVLDMI